MRFLSVLVAFVVLGCSNSDVIAQLKSGWKAHDLSRPAPTVVTPAAQPGNAPSDAIVLFDGADMSAWKGPGDGDPKWKIVEGAMESVPAGGFVYSREKFGDCQVHLEFASPGKVKGDGQGRGNSGVFMMGEFEVQILDSFDNSTYADGGAGSIYGQFPPLVNASKPPGEWQTYDIVFRRPRFSESGQLTTPARLTVFHNGVLIQDGSEAYGPTSWIVHKKYQSMAGKKEGPLSLQDHGNPVRYRNIWVRRLDEKRIAPEKMAETPRVKLSTDQAKRLVGKYGSHEVSLVDGGLVFKFNGVAELTMVPHSEVEFSFVESAGSISFEIDTDGKASGLEVQLDAAGKQTAARSE